MVYHSLTDVPRNLKECLDWLIAVKGTSKFNTQALGYALYNFLVDKPVGTTYVPSVEKVKRLSREFMQKKEFKDLPAVGDLLRRFTERMNKTDFVDIKRFFALHESDYENIVKVNGVTPDSIAKDVDKIADGCEQFLNEIKTPGQYESAYSSEATWEASCSKRPEDCAAVLVGIAPMLYAGLHSLFTGSNGHHFGTPPPNETLLVSKVMKAMGFVESKCRDGLSRSDLRHAFRDMHMDVLDTIYNFAGFWAFY
ncbi:hypothetical protein BBBOND_0403220 [Babesia bigemina]|uniref:Uncharacterized protein n=1 Tax=Babesia bigemina TaxID=5866 RepID=A0A061DE02_BABBI|nr:hypothetical protein BBBOND_0403220 [Babesia bigemina]CDR97834.1 hypothetical protein BBBOND_0403220 [Babesia bigemina]|eukprot:XP_012770020.1 hypothetical protein BBBOND_0403220 [Babesia bigemina]